MITFGDYSVDDPDALETPAILLFQDMMHHNIRSACELVGGGQNLMVHVKTHKSEAVARKQVEAGIDGFKCATLKELEMVLQALVSPQQAELGRVSGWEQPELSWPGLFGHDRGLLQHRRNYQW